MVSNIISCWSSLDELLPRLPAHSVRRTVPPVIHKRCRLGGTAAVGLPRHESTVQLQSHLPQLHLCITASISPPLCEPATAPDRTWSMPKLSVGTPTLGYPIPPADEVETKDDEFPLASQAQVHIPFQCLHRSRAVPSEQILPVSHLAHGRLICCLTSLFTSRPKIPSEAR